MINMFPPNLLYLALTTYICLTFVTRAAGLTYWFDKSCDNQLPGVEDEFKVRLKTSICHARGILKRLLIFSLYECHR